MGLEVGQDLPGVTGEKKVKPSIPQILEKSPENKGRLVFVRDKGLIAASKREERRWWVERWCASIVDAGCGRSRC